MACNKKGWHGESRRHSEASRKGARSRGKTWKSYKKHSFVKGTKILYPVENPTDKRWWYEVGTIVNGRINTSKSKKLKKSNSLIGALLTAKQYMKKH